jgi:hypothetical protein
MEIFIEINITKVIYIQKTPVQDTNANMKAFPEPVKYKYKYDSISLTFKVQIQI